MNKLDEILKRLDEIERLLKQKPEETDLFRTKEGLFNYQKRKPLPKDGD